MNAAPLRREKDTGSEIRLLEGRPIRGRIPTEELRRTQSEMAGEPGHLIGVYFDDLVVTTPFARVAVIGETAFPRIRSFEELETVHAILDRYGATQLSVTEVFAR